MFARGSRTLLFNSQLSTIVVPYHDEPPDGEAEGEPDADGVDDDAEVGVEPHDRSPERNFVVGKSKIVAESKS